MSAGIFARRSAVLLLALSFVRCASATWETSTRSPRYRIPSAIPIWVDISDEVARADDAGYTAIMVQALEYELAQHGIRADILTPSVGPEKEPRPLPRVEIVVRKWDEGSIALRYLSPVGGEPSMVVECVVLSAENRPIFVGRLRTSRTGASTSETEYPAEAAALAGKALADAIAGR